MTRRALLALAGGVFAADRKNRIPISRDILNVKFPEATAVKTSNGLTLLAIEDTRLPLVWVNIQVEGAGTLYDPRPGVAQFTAQNLGETTTGRSATQILEEAQRLGATLDSGADPNSEVARLDGKGLSARFDEWLALMMDVLMHPAFPADDCNNRKERWLVNLRMESADSRVLAENAAQRVTYGSHPAAIDAPPADAIAALTPEMSAAWHGERYSPANTVVYVIGHMKPSSVASQFERLTTGWKTPEARFALPPPPQPPSKRRVMLIDRPGSIQTELAIGGLLFERRDPGYFPMQILNQVLGSGPNSRLFQILQEGKGYAFNPSSRVTSTRYPGYWRVRAGVRTDATGDSIAVILDQLRRLCEESIPPGELEEAKTSIVGRFALNLEQPQSVISYSYQRFRYGFSGDYWERYPAKINAVTAAEVRAVAQKYLNPDRANIVAVGDAARIRSVLAKLGTVESS